MNQEKENGEALLTPRPRRANETPPMIVNDISHLAHGKMRSMDSEGVMSQHGARMILHALARNEGLRQTDLARMTHMKAPTISVTLKKMAAEGLVRHEVQFCDLRAVRLYLTEKGRAHHEDVGTMLRSMDDVMMQGFTEQETAQLSAYLNRMRDNLIRDLQANGLLRVCDECTQEDKKE